MDSRTLLEMLTAAPARRFGYAHRWGRVAVGYDADLVPVNGDPLRDPLAYADIAATIRGGQVIHRQHLAPAEGQAPAAAALTRCGRCALRFREARAAARGEWRSRRACGGVRPGVGFAIRAATLLPEAANNRLRAPTVAAGPP